jgi:crotonobetainyl-CoA:carnitine CoA-transferase CaiB-like acyl-CoA transferase
MSAPRALDGLRVLDLSQQRAGPYCTKLLAGLGADVLKVEPPTGDPLRQMGPFVGGVASAERCVPFLWLNTGKRSVTLDLAEADDRAVVQRLALEADVLVESFAPGTLRDLGLDHAALARRNPRLVTISISSFGQDGPYRDYRATERELQALGGLMHMTGEADRPPLVCGPAMAQYTAGLHAFVAALIALVRRERDGIGDHVDLSMHESVLENIETVITNFLHAGKVARRGGHAFAPWGLYQCADGWAAVIGGPFRRWRRASELFGEPRLLDPKLAHVNGRLQHRA